MVETGKGVQKQEVKNTNKGKEIHVTKKTWIKSRGKRNKIMNGRKGDRVTNK